MFSDQVLLPRARKMLAHNDKIEQSMLNLIEAIDDIEEKEKSEASKENAPVPVNQTPLVNGVSIREEFVSIHFDCILC